LPASLCWTWSGGLLGARIGRRIRPAVLRAVIIVIGVLAIVKMVWFA